MIGPLRFCRCAVSVLLIAFAALSAVPAADPKTPLAGTDIYKKVLKSTVWIAHAAQAPDGRIGIASGSGSLIDAAGRTVLTNYHVVSEQPTVAVFFPQYDSNKKLIAVRDHYTKQLLNKGGLEGKVVYRDQKRDLAVIHLPALPPGVAAVPLARERVGPGDVVLRRGH